MLLDSAYELLRHPAVYCSVFFVTAVYLIRSSIDNRPPKLDFPTISAREGEADLRAAILRGYAEYPDTPFQVQSRSKVILLLPPKYFDEIRSIPDTKWSNRKENKDLFQGQYTGLVSNSHLVVKAVNTDLTRHIGKTLDALQDEMEFAAEQNIGACEDWTSIVPYPALTRIVALISGRVMVGFPFCRDEAWINLCINFTMVCFGAAMKFAMVKPWKKPFVIPRMDATKSIHQQRKVAAKLLAPVIEERLKVCEKPGHEPSSNMLEWALDGVKSSNIERSADEQADIQLTLSMAAIHTTSTTVLYCLYDLCAHSEYIEPLREEIESVLAESDGRLVKRNMAKLRKLDSFIKESQRLSPPGLVAMRRMVLSNITLSDGTVLPKGATIAVPSWGVTRDDDLWENSETFDGFRFAKLRDAPGAEHRHQFATAGPDSLSFGYGPQACPGRFFASNEIKVLLSYLLLNYDFKFEQGVRPENKVNDLNISPDMATKVQFKRRKSQSKTVDA